MAGARPPAGVGDDNGHLDPALRACRDLSSSAGSAAQPGSEGAVEVPFDYRYARRRPQVIAPVQSTSENTAASLAGAGVVPPVSHRAADLKGQW